MLNKGKISAGGKWGIRDTNRKGDESQRMENVYRSQAACPDGTTRVSHRNSQLHCPLHTKPQETFCSGLLKFPSFITRAKLQAVSYVLLLLTMAGG